MTSSTAEQTANDETSAVDWSPLERKLEQRVAHDRAALLGAPIEGVSQQEARLYFLEEVTALAIFNVLKGLLQFPSADTQHKASIIADNVVFFCANPLAPNEDFDADWIKSKLWALLFDMAPYIPADHVWQDVLVSVVAVLRERSEPVTLSGDGEDQEEADAMEVDEKWREFWKNTTTFDVQRIEIWQGAQQHLYGEEPSHQKWKNLHSFLARLNTLGDMGDLSIPLGVMFEALETEPASDGSVADCWVWAACEWLIRCAPQILQFVNVTETGAQGDETRDKDGNREPHFSTGPLYPEGRSPLGMERWGFWRERLGELTVPGSALEKKIAEALKSMGAAECTGTAAAGQDTTVDHVKDMADVAGKN